MDQLHGILMAYEMRIEKEKPSIKETTFKASKETKTKDHKLSESSIDELDEEEDFLIRKRKKGLDKYKGRLPFKCFSCGRIWHFYIKCPYPKKKDSDDEEDHPHK